MPRRCWRRRFRLMSLAALPALVFIAVNERENLAEIGVRKPRKAHAENEAMKTPCAGHFSTTRSFGPFTVSLYKNVAHNAPSGRTRRRAAERVFPLKGGGLSSAGLLLADARLLAKLVKQ